MRKISFICILALVFISFGFQCANAATTNWYWYYSNDDITQYVDTNSLKIIRDYNGNVDRIEAWIKTTYSEAGAQSTIKNYELISTPNINQLSYSMEKVYIKPQSRQIASKQEVFYNPDGVSLWSEDNNDYSLKWNTVRPRSSNEREFSIIVDQIFNGGNLMEFEKWKTGNDRWVGLSSQQISEESIENTWFDNMSIVLDDNRIYFWLYQEDIKYGNITEKRYSRWKYDAKSDTLQAIMLSVWEKDKGWTVNDKSIIGKIESNIPESAGEYWSSKVKKYVEENREYINRFQKILTSPKLPSTKSNYDFTIPKLSS